MFSGNIEQIEFALKSNRNNGEVMPEYILKVDEPILSRLYARHDPCNENENKVKSSLFIGRPQSGNISKNYTQNSSAAAAVYAPNASENVTVHHHHHHK